MTEDYIEPDPLDPDAQAEAEKKLQESAERQAHIGRQQLDRRQRAYRVVFGTEGAKATDEDLRIVMLDLGKFCRAFVSSHEPTAPHMLPMLEGRREVFMRILDHTTLDYEVLYAKYHTQNKGEN